jgi:rSAM/selenodomain-associated transferase 2
MPDPSVSIVIPALNEAATLPRLLAALATEPTAEIIVVDGGSTDGTAALAASAGARVLVTRPGRGSQLAAGAEAAAGDILLFLHADTTFPAGGLAAMDAALAADPALVGGNFTLLFDGGTPFDAWLTWRYAWARRRGLYYGDSGVFVRRDAYQRLGGIRPLALMEDYEFTRRLERLGPTCCIASPPLVTSSRRFAGRHPVAIVAGWIAIHLLYHLGVPPAVLAWLYDSPRRRRHPAVQRPSSPFSAQS